MMSRWVNNDQPWNDHDRFDGPPLGGCRGIMFAFIVYGIAIIVVGIVYWWVWA